MRHGRGFEVSASSTSPVSVMVPCAMEAEVRARIKMVFFIVSRRISSPVIQVYLRISYQIVLRYAI